MGRMRGMWWLSMAGTVLTMAVIFGFSGQPASDSSALSGGITMKLLPLVQSVVPIVTMDGLHHFLRKLAHFSVYFILGCCLTSDFSIQGKFPPILCAIAAGGLFAASDEVHQLFSEGRSGNVQDVILDTCGVAVGSLAMFCLGKLLLRRKEKCRHTAGGGPV